MNERIISTAEAWRDFRVNIFPALNGIPWQEMNTIKQALRDEARDLLGEKRIKKLLTKYAPDRYRFEERVILIEP